MKHKITVVGAGNVGATAAQRIVEKELADVVLVDILEGVPFGKALDLAEAAPIEKHDAQIEPGPTIMRPPGIPRSLSLPPASPENRA